VTGDGEPGRWDSGPLVVESGVSFFWDFIFLLFIYFEILFFIFFFLHVSYSKYMNKYMFLKHYKIIILSSEIIFTNKIFNK
jgi:hypothetical protein